MLVDATKRKFNSKIRLQPCADLTVSYWYTVLHFCTPATMLACFYFYFGIFFCFRCKNFSTPRNAFALPTAVTATTEPRLSCRKVQPTCERKHKWRQASNGNGVLAQYLPIQICMSVCCFCVCRLALRQYYVQLHKVFASCNVQHAAYKCGACTVMYL